MGRSCAPCPRSLPSPGLCLRSDGHLGGLSIPLHPTAPKLTGPTHCRKESWIPSHCVCLELCVRFARPASSAPLWVSGGRNLAPANHTGKQGLRGGSSQQLGLRAPKFDSWGPRPDGLRCSNTFQTCTLCSGTWVQPWALPCYKWRCPTSCTPTPPASLSCLHRHR